MKSIIQIAALSLLASCACSQRVSLPDTTQRPAVAQLVMVDPIDGSEQNVCSAWKVDENLVATAAHCCDPIYTYKLAVPHVKDEVPAKILTTFDPDQYPDVDVCVIEAKIPGNPIPLAVSEPDVGEHVWTIGWPKGLFLISEGVWTGLELSHHLNVASITTQPGASGSPVLDATGHAVGVLVRYKPGMDNAGMIVPLANLRWVIERARTYKD